MAFVYIDFEIDASYL